MRSTQLESSGLAEPTDILFIHLLPLHVVDILCKLSDLYHIYTTSIPEPTPHKSLWLCRKELPRNNQSDLFVWSVYFV